MNLRERDERRMEAEQVRLSNLAYDQHMAERTIITIELGSNSFHFEGRLEDARMLYHMFLTAVEEKQ